MYLLCKINHQKEKFKIHFNEFKKNSWYIFLVLAILLTLAIIGLLPTLFGVVINFSQIFTGKLNGFQVGEVFGQTIYWTIHFVATILLWKYGIHWISKKNKA